MILEQQIEKILRADYEIFEDGTKIFRDENGRVHNDLGPAIIRKDGTQFWFKDGKLHREDGPAVEWPNGRKEWWLHDAPVLYPKHI